MTQDMGNNISYRSKALAREMASSKQALGRLMSMLRVCLHYAYIMLRVCLEYGLRLTSDDITARRQRDYGSCPTRLRLVMMLLLMMVVGVCKMWGQTPDYSGTYYIASNGNAALANGNADNNYAYSPSTPATNYYLVPASDPVLEDETDAYFDGTGETKPFLTTFKTGLADEAVWVITQVIDDDGIFYYIKHQSLNKYVVYEQFLSGDYWRRKCMHLNETSYTESDTDAGKFLITYNSTDGYYNIVPKSLRSTTHRYWSISDKNRPFRYGIDTKNKTYYGGLLGVYSSATDVNSKFCFEDKIKRPTIGYDASGNIIITNNDANTTVYYSIGGNSDPKTNGTVLSGTTKTLTSFTDGTIIKAVAKVGNEYSNVVTSTVFFHVGSSNQYLIQNLECTDFYMVPGDASGENTYVNTTSLFRPTMSWYFSNAGSVDGVQFYYIINASTGEYLYRTSNSIYMKTSSVFDSSDGYKFFIEQGYKAENDPDGFHIVPKGVTDNTYCIYKGGWAANTLANSKTDAVKGGSNARDYSYKHTRWKFVQPNTLNKTAPFTVTDASTHITKFYKIANVGNNAYYIIPPTGDNTNGTMSNSSNAATVKSGTWYFEKAQDATDDDWCTYYHIRNAETGQYLYFTKDASGENIYSSEPKACLEMRNTIAVGNEDRYKFTWARTAAVDANYYIVPKVLKDVSHNSISTILRSSPIKSSITRSAGDYAWTFVEAPLFCSNPVFEEVGDNIIISCQNIAEIHYTTNGDDPSADGITYSVYPPTTPFSKSGQHIIKACSVVSDGATPTPNTASSDVITYIKNPDVNFVEGNEFPYAAGSAIVPTISSVTVTPEGGSAITIDGSEYSIAYSNNTDVGTATVTISDALPTNNTIISGISNFTITPKSLGNGSTAADGITITLTKTGENTYDVTVQNGAITLTPYNSADPTAPYDYTVSGTPDESGFVAIVEAKKEAGV